MKIELIMMFAFVGEMRVSDAVYAGRWVLLPTVLQLSRKLFSSLHFTLDDLQG